MVSPGLGVGVVRELAGEVKVVSTRVLALELYGAFYLSLGVAPALAKNKKKTETKTKGLAEQTKQNEHGKLEYGLEKFKTPT